MNHIEETHLCNLIIWKVNATKVLRDCKQLLENYMHETAPKHDVRALDNLMQTLNSINEILK
jgi:hypothetical protein